MINFFRYYRFFRLRRNVNSCTRTSGGGGGGGDGGGELVATNENSFVAILFETERVVSDFLDSKRKIVFSRREKRP